MKILRLVTALAILAVIVHRFGPSLGLCTFAFSCALSVALSVLVFGSGKLSVRARRGWQLVLTAIRLIVQAYVAVIAAGADLAHAAEQALSNQPEPADTAAKPGAKKKDKEKETWLQLWARGII